MSCVLHASLFAVAEAAVEEALLEGVSPSENTLKEESGSLGFVCGCISLSSLSEPSFPVH